MDRALGLRMDRALGPRERTNLSENHTFPVLWPDQQGGREVRDSGRGDCAGA